MGIKKMLLGLEMGIQEQDGEWEYGKRRGNIEKDIWEWDWEYRNGNRTGNMGLRIWQWQLDREYGTGNETRNGVRTGMGAGWEWAGGMGSDSSEGDTAQGTMGDGTGGYGDSCSTGSP